MPTTKKFDFTLDQVSNVQFDAETKILTFTFGDEIQEIHITPKEDSSRVEFIEFSDNQLLSLADIAEAFDLPEIATAAGASPDTNGLSQYDDNAGNLIGGVDRLGTLESSRLAFRAEDRNFASSNGNRTNGNSSNNNGNNNGNGNNGNDNNGNDNNGNDNNGVYSVVFSPDSTEVFESHLDHGTHVVHGEVVPQDDSYTKATGTFEITGGYDYKGEVTFSIGNESITIELPLVGESSTKNIGEDTYTITHDSNGHYSYEYTLNSPKNHSGAPIDDHGDKYIDTHIHVTLTDPTDNTVIASGDTAINIINDGITATNPDTIVLTESSPHYVTIALDVSNSMEWSAKWGKNVPAGEEEGETRYDVAVKAIIALMEEYKEVSPDTQVNLFLFNTNVQSINAHTPQEVIDYFETHNFKSDIINGGTDYNKVLDTMVNTVEKGIEHSDYTNQVIFISDGAADDEKDYSQKWHDLVNGEHAKDLDVFAVGIGNNINDEAQKNLEGVCNAEELGQSTGDMYIHVDDLDKLADTLHDVMNVTSGNLAANNVLGADGVNSFYGIVVDGTEHQIDWTGKTDTIDSDGYYKIYLAGDANSENYTLMKINSHGDYILQVHGTVEDATYNDIKLILEDSDGDRLTLTGTIEIVSSNGDHHSTLTTSVEETQSLTASYDSTSDAVANDTHSLAVSDNHTSDTITDDTHSLGVSYDHIFDAVTDEVDIFNFAEQGQSSNADHVNLFTLDTGSNLINNFTLGEDKIAFEDILSEDEPLIFTSILSHLEDGSLSVEEVNDHSSEITITLDGLESTTIGINFDSSVFSSPDPSLEEQALFLLRLANG